MSSCTPLGCHCSCFFYGVMFRNAFHMVAFAPRSGRPVDLPGGCIRCETTVLLACNRSTPRKKTFGTGSGLVATAKNGNPENEKFPLFPLPKNSVLSCLRRTTISTSTHQKRKARKDFFIFQAVACFVRKLMVSRGGTYRRP